MDIDLQVLRLLEREREIPFEELVLIIEAAILAAFQKSTEEPIKGARAELDRKTGHVKIFQPILSEDEEPGLQAQLCLRVLWTAVTTANI